MEPITKPHVVILGGGFAGLAAARLLASSPVRVTLIDRRNHHLFQPLLYQVATAALNPSEIAFPIRSAVKDAKNISVLLAEARAIDVAGKRVVLDDGELCFDYLIVATGATHSYFGHDWEKQAPGLKTIEDALEIRRRVFLAYEAAERESDPEQQAAWLTFVVVGAGPTGVELAGALGEIGLHTLAHDFRRIDPTRVKVMLVEGGPRILASYPEKLSLAAIRALQKRSVQVRVNARVTDVRADGVTVSVDGISDPIAARTVLWAAGVQGSPLARDLGAQLDGGGRVMVDPDLSLPGHPSVFVVGDLAHARHGDHAVPQVAQGALQGGHHVALIIAREVAGKPARPAFRYRDKGSMATIGRASAVVSTRRVAISGGFAWLLWWAVHILFLIGFRNRFLVMFQWAWSWLTFQRGARLITGPIGALPRVSPPTRRP